MVSKVRKKFKKKKSCRNVSNGKIIRKRINRNYSTLSLHTVLVGGSKPLVSRLLGGRYSLVGGRYVLDGGRYFLARKFDFLYLLGSSVVFLTTSGMSNSSSVMGWKPSSSAV